MALALDTNCVLRWLLNDNADQATIVENHLRSATTRLRVEDMVFAESIWVLKKFYEFDDDMIEGFMRKIVEHDKISCNRALFKKVLDGLAHTPKVSFVDLCLAHYAELNGAKLLTFDKTLAKRFPTMVKLAG